MGAHRKNASHLEADFRTTERISPAVHMHHASPRGSLSKTNILIHPDKNFKATARFSFHRNESSHVSMSIQSDYKRQVSQDHFMPPVNFSELRNSRPNAMWDDGKLDTRSQVSLGLKNC